MRLCGAAVRDKQAARLGHLRRPALAIKQMLDQEEAGHAKGSRQRNCHMSWITPHTQQSHQANHQDWRVHAIHQAAIAGRR